MSGVHSINPLAMIESWKNHLIDQDIIQKLLNQTEIEICDAKYN